MRRTAAAIDVICYLACAQTAMPIYQPICIYCAVEWRYRDNADRTYCIEVVND